MKRYEQNDPDCKRCCGLSESEDGEWVKWDDVKEMIDGHNDLVAEIDSVDCNCAEMAENRPYWWICPAHGYKRL